MNTRYGEITFVENRDGLTVQSHGDRFTLGCDTGPVRASIVYTRKEAEALCRDLAQRLGYFLAPQHGDEAPVAPEMTEPTRMDPGFYASPENP